MNTTASYASHLPTAAERLASGDLLVAKTALVLIDLQRLDADPTCGVGPQLLAQDHEGHVEAYFSRIRRVVRPAAREVLEAARRAGAVVVHVHVASPAQNGSDLSLRYRRLGFRCASSSREAEFLPGLEPTDGEAVVAKITSGAFVGTVLDSWLRSEGVQTVAVGGVVTNGCVESTVRHGADLGYRMVLVEDACAALSEAEHRSSLAQLDGNFAIVASSGAVSSLLSQQQ